MKTLVPERGERGQAWRTATLALASAGLIPLSGCRLLWLFSNQPQGLKAFRMSVPKAVSLALCRRPARDRQGLAQHELDARALRARDVHGLDVVPLDAGRARAGHGLHQRPEVLDQSLLADGRLPDHGVDDAGLVDAELDATALRVLHGLGHVHRYRAGLRVRHETARTEHAAETADLSHHVGRRDGDVEVEPAALDLLREILRADRVGPGGLRVAA